MRLRAAIRRAIARPIFRALEMQRRVYGRTEAQWCATPLHRKRLEKLAAFVGLERRDV